MVKEEEATVNKNGKGRSRAKRARPVDAVIARASSRSTMGRRGGLGTGICRGRNGSGACRVVRTALRTSGRAPGAAVGARGGSLVMGGRRVKVERPRARGVDGHELSLPSWRAWSSRDPWDERAFEQMVLGVSTRRYARSLEALPHEFEVRGTGKSAVSERFVVGTQRRLAELMRSDLLITA
jgi:hypothetical protein